MEPDKTHTQNNVIKLLKREKQFLESARDKHNYLEEHNNLNYNNIPIWNHRKHKEGGTFFKCWKKRNVTCEFYIEQKYPSGMKRK